MKLLLAHAVHRLHLRSLVFKAPQSLFTYLIPHFTLGNYT